MFFYQKVITMLKEKITKEKPSKSFYSQEEKNPNESAIGYANNSTACNFLLPTDSYWTTCRNAWVSKDKKNVDIFFISHKKDHGENIASFIHRVEFKLRLKNKSIIGRTKSPYVSWVRRSEWWSRGEATGIVRRSLFTALLRCGHNYNLKTKDFETALYSTPYTRQTKKAIEEFFKGNTVYHGKKSTASYGWQDTLSPNLSVVDKILQKPKTKEEQEKAKEEKARIKEEKAKLKEEKRKAKEAEKEAKKALNKQKEEQKNH
jgi:hypothetical protein